MLRAIHHQGYDPPPIRRVYISKPGKAEKRPLGIPCVTDRALQRSVYQVLSAIYEEDFQLCSFGGRPGTGAHHALATLNEVISGKPVSWVLEADLKNFFGTLDHGWLLCLVEHRVGDPRMISLTRRWLKSGVLEDGDLIPNEEGTPQGVITPVLSNIYLHYVQDLWFEQRYAKSCSGQAYLIRYADDYVACFAREADARRFQTEMEQRLAQFDLQVEPSKTTVLRFGNEAGGGVTRDRNEPRTFSFLGFTHYVGRSRTGRFVVGRTTEGRRVPRKLKQFSERLRALRNDGTSAMVAYARRHLQGHIQYYGVSGNSRGWRAMSTLPRTLSSIG